MPPPAVPHGMCLKVINNRSMKGGMGSETNPLRFMDQDFNVLQDYCLKTKQRFVDEFFPPDPRSIGEGLLEPDDMARVEWIRPTVCRQTCVLLEAFGRYSDNIAQKRRRSVKYTTLLKAKKSLILKAADCDNLNA